MHSSKKTIKRSGKQDDMKARRARLNTHMRKLKYHEFHTGTQTLTRTHDTLGRLHYLDATWGTASTMPQIEYVYDSTTDKLNRVSGMSRHVAFSNFADVNLPGTMEFKIGANPATAATYMTRTQTVDTAGRTGYIGYTSGSTMLQSFTYAYDRYSVTDVTRENGHLWNYTYDTKGQVGTAIKRTATGQPALRGMNTTYNYDQIGNRTTVRENSAPALTTTYTSNALNQYTQVGLSSRSFDVSGYRSSSSSPIQLFQNNGAAQTPIYSPSFTGLFFWRRLTHGGSNDFWDLVETKENGTTIDYGYQYVPPLTEIPTYDADGNLLSDGRRNYVWDAENRLIEINWTAAQSPMAGYSGKITYTYDGLSRRVSRTNSITWTATNTTYCLDALGYQFDGWNHIMTVRFNSAGVPTGRQAAYVWGPDVASSYQAGRSMQGAGGVGGLLMVLDGVSLPEYQYTSDPNPIDDDYFPLMDRMGNVTAYKKASTTTPAAQLDAIYDYDAFGQEVRSTGPAADVVPYHFSTKFADASGLVYYGYRWYDPAKGRWLSQDPIGETGGLNLVGMVGNNNITRFDRLGLDWWSSRGDPPPPPSSEPYYDYRPPAGRRNYEGDMGSPSGGIMNNAPNWDMSLQGSPCSDDHATLDEFSVKSSWSSPNIILRPSIKISGRYAKLQIRYFSCWAPDPQGTFPGDFNSSRQDGIRDAGSTVGDRAGYRHEYDNKMKGAIKLGIGGPFDVGQLNRVEIGYYSCNCGRLEFTKHQKAVQANNSFWGRPSRHGKPLPND